MNMKAILTINAGSATLKYALFEVSRMERLMHGNVDGHDIVTVLSDIKKSFPDIQILGASHRVVHGGLQYSAPVLLDKKVFDDLTEIIPLAPLHMKPELEAMQAVTELDASLPQVACFDTAFHSTMSRLNRIFAIPREYSDAGILRYGFHGLSYQYVASKFPEVLGDMASGRVVVAHLGNGSSMCAMRDMKSVGTSMGFTALDGLVMGTRCGSIDPGVLLYLMEQKGLSVQELSRLLNYESGLLGVSSVSNDLRELEEMMDNPNVSEAIDLFCHRAACELGKFTMVLGGIDALVFTGGIGQHSSTVRGKVLEYLSWLGVVLDDSANLNNSMRISGDSSTLGVYIIPTNEEIVLAQEAAKLLGVGA